MSKSDWLFLWGGWSLRGLCDNIIPEHYRPWIVVPIGFVFITIWLFKEETP